MNRWEFNAGPFGDRLNERWQPYDTASSAQLERAFASRLAQFTLLSRFGAFQIDFERMLQTNERGARAVRRVELPTPPPIPPTAASPHRARPGTAPETSSSPLLASSPPSSASLSGGGAGAAAAPSSPTLPPHATREEASLHAHKWQVDLSTYGDGGARDAVWVEYDQETSDTIEARWVGGATARQFRVTTSGGRTFDIDLISFDQIAVGTYGRRKIRRARVEAPRAAAAAAAARPATAPASTTASGGGGGGGARGAAQVAVGSVVTFSALNSFGYAVVRTGEVVGVQSNGSVLVLVDYPVATRAVPRRFISVVPPPPRVDPASLPC